MIRIAKGIHLDAHMLSLSSILDLSLFYAPSPTQLLESVMTKVTQSKQGMWGSFCAFISDLCCTFLAAALYAYYRIILFGVVAAGCVFILKCMYFHYHVRMRGFLAATKQLYEWYFLSVCPSVTPFWLCSHHRIIMKFSGVITKDQGKVHVKGQDQRSKVKVTEVTTQLNRFRTVTPVWINIWWWNDTYSLMLLGRGALLFFKVIRQIWRSHGAKIVEFDPDWAFPDCNSSLNSPMAMKCCTKLEVA